MPLNPAVDLHAALEIALPTLSLIAGPFPSVDVAGVEELVSIVNAVGGPPPSPDHSTTPVEIYKFRLIVRTRGEQKDLASSETLATTVYAALHRLVVAGYMEARALDPFPYWAYEDDNGRHVHTFNVEMLAEA